MVLPSSALQRCTKRVSLLKWIPSRNGVWPSWITRFDLSIASHSPPIPHRGIHEGSEPGFAQLGLSEPLVSALRKASLFNPTPIQNQAIPRILQGESMVLSAETGTGKTLAYVLPLLEKIHSEMNLRNEIHDKESAKKMENKVESVSKKENNFPSCLILTPTTELASQVHNDVNKMIGYLKNINVELLTSATSGGNASKRSSILMKKNISILIATPGRLLHLLEQGSVKIDEEKRDQIRFLHSLDPDFQPQKKTNLNESLRMLPQTGSVKKDAISGPIDDKYRDHSETEYNSDTLRPILGLKTDYLMNVKYWVLDECDRMARMGMLEYVKKLFTFLPKPNKELNSRLQVVLVSATVLPEAEFILRRFSPYREVLNLNPTFQVAKSIKHIAYQVNSFRKHALLAYLLRRRGSMKGKRVLIFVRTMKRAEQLAELLKKDGFSTFHLHGERSAGARRQILNSFKNENFQCLVCTDVLGRGIDIPALPFVVNYDAPSHAEEYVHRVGRTGRAGLEGMAISFISKHPFAVKCGEGFKPIDEMKNLEEIEKLIQCRIERRKVPGPWRDSDDDDRVASIKNFVKNLEKAKQKPSINEETIRNIRNRIPRNGLVQKSKSKSFRTRITRIR